MNAALPANVSDLWFITGWTMIHFLWLGAIVASAALVSRMLLRRATAKIRYMAALASLILLAALPLVTAAWLMKYSPPATAETAMSAIPARHLAENLPASAPAVTLSGATSDTPPSVPGSAGGLVASPPQNNLATIAPATQNPRQSRGLADNALAATPAKFTDVLNAFIPYLPWLWLVGTPLTFALLISGVVGTSRLSRASRAIENGPIVELLAHLATSLSISRRVAIAVCDRIASPVLIGIVRPMILLPPAALTGWSPDEIEMVLLHELAHVHRWDNLVNLLQRCLESLLFFHPAVWLISAWARSEREACCDATVVSRTNRPHAYAELLVALAAQLPRSVLFHPAASSAMAAGPLRSRIRRILKLEEDPMLISGKSLAIVLAAAFTATVALVLYLPTTGHAEPSTASEAAEGGVKQDRDDNASKSKNGNEEFKALDITLKADGPNGTKIYLNGKEVNDFDLSEVIERAAEEQDKSLISVRGERGVPFGDMIALVNKLEAKGIKKISLDTRDTLATDKFPYVVPFEKGVTKFLEGDDITIDEVRGTAADFEPGNTYQIKGKYKLHSHPGALLLASTTITAPDIEKGFSVSAQSLKIDRGESDFTLVLPFNQRGFPHVSFYTMDKGQGFGGTYFGTGDYLQYSGRPTNKKVQQLLGEISATQQRKWKLESQLHEDPHNDEQMADYKRASKTLEEQLQVLQLKLSSQTAKEAAEDAREKPSPNADSAPTGESALSNDTDRTRFEHFEKSLKTIELVIAVFNDSAGYSHQLEPVYKNLIREHHSLDLWGSNVDPNSPDARRYHLGAAPTCIVFHNGKETARLTPIKDAEQLKQFVERATNSDENSASTPRILPRLRLTRAEIEQKYVEAQGRQGVDMTKLNDRDRDNGFYQWVFTVTESNPLRTQTYAGKRPHWRDVLGNQSDKLTQQPWWKPEFTFTENWSADDREVTITTTELAQQLFQNDIEEISGSRDHSPKLFGDGTMPIGEVLATLPESWQSDAGLVGEVLSKLRDAWKKNLCVDLVYKDGKWLLVVVHQPTEKDWPTILGEPPRKDRVISEKAWRRLGIKLIPLNAAENNYQQMERGVGGAKIIGGNVPKGLPIPSILTSVGGMKIESMDMLLQWLDGDDGQAHTPVRCFATADDNEYMFDAAPPTTSAQDGSGNTSQDRPTPTTVLAENNTYAPPVLAASPSPYSTQPDHYSTAADPLQSSASSSADLNVTEADQAYKQAAEQLDKAAKAKQDALANREHAKDAEAAKRELENVNRQFEKSKQQFEKAKRELENRIDARVRASSITSMNSNSPPVTAPGPMVAQTVVARNGDSVPTSAPSNASPYASPSDKLPWDSGKLIEYALQRKNEAMDRRLAAKTDKEIEESKRDLEAANKQLEKVKRQIEEAKRQIEIQDQQWEKQNAEKSQKSVDGLHAQPRSAPSPNSDPSPHSAAWPTAEPAWSNATWPQATPSAPASAEEIEVLRDRVKTIEDQTTIMQERFKAGKGATQIDVKRASIELAVAQSDLAVAEGHRDTAIEKLQDALKQAQEVLEIEKTSARAGIGSPDLEEIMKSSKSLSDIKLKLIRLQHERPGSRNSSDEWGHRDAHPQPEPPSQ